MSAEDRRRLGCDGKKATVGWRAEDGVYIYECMERLLEGWWWAVKLWDDWKTFGLAYPGSPSEQPAIYMDVLRVAEAAHREAVEEARERAAEKGQHG